MDEIGQVRQVDIDAEMRTAYLDYAMSVIVSRALPDARDGLKPVHRRILYAMYDMGLNPDTPYRKSARIVGEVLGKYHPHGDQAIYDSMVRMAQDFSMRYPLVDGQGNFGSIDGDNAAAMRYTEARMFQLGSDMLLDIQRSTVDFEDNFDGSLREPSVLPSSLPNLLVNGASGIAVGMSTSVPPHNMREVCDALVFMLDRWASLDDIGLPDLMQFITGPDFPTGGIVFRYNKKGEDRLANSYATGRGKLTLQARAHVEQLSRNRSRIIITELPYQANKTNLLEKIAGLVRDEKIEGITDLRDETDRQGMRIVMDLTRTVDPEDILAQLYKSTPMRQTFSVIMLALVNGEPRMLSLKQALRVYLEHRIEIVQRRTEYELARARERAHILEGYITALDNLDEVIETIRRSRTVQSARNNLQRRFSLSEEQAQAILDMPLRRLASMERKKIEDEYKEKVELIDYYESLLEDPAKLRSVIRDELTELRQQYADPRRTLIVDSAETDAIFVSDILPDEEAWAIVTQSGKLSRTVDDQPPRVTTAVDDPPRVIHEAVASDVLYLIAEDGNAATIALHQVPKAADFERGEHYATLTALRDDQRVVSAVALPDDADTGFLFLATRQGIVKRIAVADLPGLAANAFTVMNLDDGDRIIAAEWTTGENEIMLVSAEGKAIRFSEDDVRPMGLRAGGVMGIKLADDTDEVVGAVIANPEANLWVVTTEGEAKSSPVADYPTQGRYGQGVITMRLSKTSARLAAAAIGKGDDNIIVVTDKGKPKYMRLGYAPETGRNATGQSIIALRGSEQVTHVVTYQPRLDFV